ncbi:MAG: response regulator [Flavobacteriales bacterium]|nr:response regulator [Flavobacteriales bacterium]
MKRLKSKILLVDDRPENLLLLRKIIENPGREVFSTTSGNEALKLALEHSFALILTDVQMPEMDGFEMLEILRLDDKNKYTPVIFVTALSKEDKYVHRGYSEGAVDYLFKPLSTQVVRAKVDVFVSLNEQRLELLEQANTLIQLNEEKNKFLGMAAHDLRNPIAVFQHYSKFLIEDLHGNIPEESFNFLEVIHATSKLMMTLVDELLDVTKIESGTFKIDRERTKLNRIVKNSLLMNENYAKRKSIKIESVLAEELPDLNIDSRKIGQVLDNLINNAIKYSPESTRVLVTTHFEKGQGVITVSDQGPGIAEDEIPILFEAYKTTKNKPTAGEKSTGLGLSIVAKIIEAHDGEIVVVSKPNEGSKFIVKLPATEFSEKALFHPMDDRLNPDEDKISVLFVEDDIFIRSMSERLYKDFDINLIFAVDGYEALSILESNNNINIVFTDINMPNMDGFELTKNIRQIRTMEDLAVVAVSSCVDDDFKNKCMEVGINESYIKPMSLRDLKKAVNNYVPRLKSVKV